MKHLIAVLLAFLSLLPGYGRAEARPDNDSPARAGAAIKMEVHKISAQEAHRMMSELKDYVLLDVRSDKEYRQGRIDGAYLISDNEITDRAEKELPDKNKAILVYCRSGGRSAKAAAELIRLGYKNVYDFGGIIHWPFATVSR